MISQKTNEFHRWKPAAWLRVTGEDAAGFLQGQFTNDLREVRSVRGIYGLWLNQKGRVLADGFVIAGVAGELWVGSYFSPAAVLRARLEAYVIADDVVLEDLTDERRAVTVFRGEPGAWPEGAVVFAGRRGRQASWEVVYAPEREAQVAAWLARAGEIGAEEMMRRRVAAGIPAVPADLGPGDLPNEGGLDGVAISTTKGCYLGQEVMARLKAMGQVRRRLHLVTGDGPAPVCPAALFQGDRQVGELRSAVADGGGFAGLALLSLLQLKADAGLSLAAGGAAGLSVVKIS